MNNNFKDKCDVCGKFDYCKGSNGLILCDKCITNNKEIEIKTDDNLLDIKGQTTIFDYI